MEKSKAVKINEKIADTVKCGYNAVEKNVVEGYKKIETAVTDGYQKNRGRFC